MKIKMQCYRLSCSKCHITHSLLLLLLMSFCSTTVLFLPSRYQQLYQELDVKIYSILPILLSRMTFRIISIWPIVLFSKCEVLVCNKAFKADTLPKGEQMAVCCKS